MLVEKFCLHFLELKLSSTETIEAFTEIILLNFNQSGKHFAKVQDMVRSKKSEE